MSYYSTTTAYKPQIRQEGFTPLNTSNGGGNGGGSGGSPDGGPSADLFSINSHYLDGPVSRKQPSSSSTSNMDFTDELATFIGTAPTEKNGMAHHHQHHQQHNPYGQDDRPYNIFDTSAPPGASAALNGNNQPGAHPSSVSSTTSGFSEYHTHHAPPPFNSTLPALNSSMRYEPHPDPPYNARHTPSPIHSQPGVHSPILPPPSHVGVGVAAHHHLNSRSRSRSRPPTSSSSNEGNQPNAANPSGPPGGSGAPGGIGPARTTRTRRNNSVSSTSPPPYGRPHAIVIPGSRGGAGSGNGNNWFVSSQSSASDFSLPTPSSDIGPNAASHNPATPSNGPHSPLSQSHGYTPFGLSPPNESVLGGGKGPLEFSLNATPSGGNTQGFHNMPGHGIQPHPPSSHGHGHNHSLSQHGYFTPSSSVPSVGGLGSMGGTPQGHHNSAISSSLPSTSLLGGNMTGNMGMGMNMGMSTFGLGLGGNGTSSQGSNSTTATLTPGAQTTPPGVSIGGGSSQASANTSNLTSQDKQALLANEKRRRRRESHNAVERRRRDNINEKISELATLIPECLLEGAGGATGGGNGPNSPGGANAPSPSALLDTNSDPLLPSVISGSKKEDVKGEDGLDGGGPDAGVVKANKGMILKKSVEYIRYLQQLVTAQGARNRELENELNQYRGHSTSGSDGTSSHIKSGTAHSTSPSEGGDPDAENKDHDSSEAGSSVGGPDPDADMMLHDATSPGGMDFGMGMGMNVGMGGFAMHPQMRRRGSSGVGRNMNGAGMLPSMPEGEHEDDEALEGGLSLVGDAESDSGIMDVDMGAEERGRTSVRGKRNGPAISHLKEEIADDYSVHLSMVGMQH